MRPDVRRLVKNSVILVVIIWIISFMLLLLPKDERGVFGDMFGAVNALFSGLAFAGIILTLYIQQQDSSRQQFENTFFNLLTFYKDTIDEIIPNDGQESGMGKQFFHRFMNKLQISYNESHYPDERNKISSSVILLMGEEVSVITNWLDKIYRILYYIHKYCPTNESLYYGIFHSRMSNHETALLFYLVYSLPPDKNDPSLRDLLITSRFFQITNAHVFFDPKHSDVLAPSFE